MKITLICSDASHPVNAYLEEWIKHVSRFHEVELIRDKASAKGGDLLFLISCSQLISAQDRQKYGSCLVLHASDLPHGRGWSPHIWELLNGAEQITLSLLEADDKLDQGAIWKKVSIPIPKHALWNEINHLLFEAEIQLIDFAIENYKSIVPTPQTEEPGSNYFPRRTPDQSRIDPHKTLAEQFDCIRVCDPIRFPAFFEYLGKRYILKLEKSNEE